MFGEEGRRLGIFTVLLLATLGLVGVLWILVKLKELRERPLDGGLPNDEATLMLGVYYAISQGCVAYFRAKNRYPGLISGSKEGLYEQGFIKEEMLPGGGLALIPMFTVVPTESTGYGICLHNVNAQLAKQVIERVEMSGGRVLLVNYNRETLKYEPIPPNNLSAVNLTLPLPLKPMSVGSGNKK